MQLEPKVPVGADCTLVTHRPGHNITDGRNFVKRVVIRAVLAAVLLSHASFQPAQGQVLLGILFGDRLATERFHIGLNVGANFADLSGIDGTKLKPGLTLGLVAEWRIAGNFYLQPELLPFYQAGAKSMPPAIEDAPPPLDTLVADKSAQRNLSYFEIPVADISDTQVLKTVFEGRVVYER